MKQRLDAFEVGMRYSFYPGALDFIQNIRANGVKCAIVTSSNALKMEQVYKHHPEFKTYFDRVLTSEDFAKSKPDPDCYLKGAACFGAKPEECVGLEDSFNGLKAVRASGAFTLGLATTNSAESIQPYSDYVIADYDGFGYDDLEKIVERIIRK